MILAFKFGDFFVFRNSILKTFLAISYPFVNFHRMVFFLDDLENTFMQYLDFMEYTLVSGCIDIIYFKRRLKFTVQ